MTCSSYLVISRRFGSILTYAVGEFCAATALLAGLAQLTWAVVLACGWIIGGAILAAGDFFAP